MKHKPTAKSFGNTYLLGNTLASLLLKRSNLGKTNFFRPLF